MHLHLMCFGIVTISIILFSYVTLLPEICLIGGNDFVYKILNQLSGYQIRLLCAVHNNDLVKYTE